MRPVERPRRRARIVVVLRCLGEKFLIACPSDVLAQRIGQIVERVRVHVGHRRITVIIIFSKRRRIFFRLLWYSVSVSPLACSSSSPRRPSIIPTTIFCAGGSSLN